MPNRLLTLWRQRPLVGTAFLLACAATLFFAGNLISSALYWADPAHRNQVPRPWMTVGYVARSWEVPGPEIDRMAGFPGPEESDHPLTLAEIASRRGVPVAEVIAEVEKAIAVLKARELLKPVAPKP